MIVTLLHRRSVPVFGGSGDGQFKLPTVDLTVSGVCYRDCTHHITGIYSHRRHCSHSTAASLNPDHHHDVFAIDVVQVQLGHRRLSFL